MSKNTDHKYIDNHILDLREELEGFLPHFQCYGLRHLDYSRKCDCAKETKDGIESPVYCTRCFRTGYLFTDYLVNGYMWVSSLGFEFRTSVGQISTQRTNFVCKHNRTINKFDFVLALDMDPNNGELRQPLKIMRSYEVQDSLPIYGKNGRIEFFKCSLEERNIDDGRPGERGTGYKYIGNRSNNEPW